MTIERLEELKEWFHDVAGRLVSSFHAENCYLIDYLIDDEIDRLSEPCEWCEGNVSKYFDVNWYDFTTNNTGNSGARPKAKFCPFCGRDV